MASALKQYQGINSVAVIGNYLIIVATIIGLEFGFINEAFKDAIILLAVITCLLGPSLFQSVFQIRSRVERRRRHREKKVIRRLDAAMEMSKQNTTNFEDIIQDVVGACALCVPVVFSEEARNLGRTLPAANIIVLVVLSLLFVRQFVFPAQHFSRQNHASNFRLFRENRHRLRHCAAGSGRRAVRPGPYAHFQRAMGGRQARRGALFARLDGSGGRG